jgi:hypothetical protein
MSTVDFSALSIDGKGADDREIVDRQLRIRGGQPLHGDVRVRGAKNTLPKNMVASLLTDETCVLRNVAGVVDVEIAAQMIDALGGSVGKPGSGELTMRTADPEVLSSDRLAYFAGRAGSRCSSAARSWRDAARSSSPTSVDAPSVPAPSTSTSTPCASSAPTSARSPTAGA